MEITIRDYGKKKIETHTFNGKDSKKYGAVIRYLKDKYGFIPTIDVDESINNIAKDDEAHDKDKFDWWA